MQDANAAGAQEHPSNTCLNLHDTHTPAAQYTSGHVRVRVLCGLSDLRVCGSTNYDFSVVLFLQLGRIVTHAVLYYSTVLSHCLLSRTCRVMNSTALVSSCRKPCITPTVPSCIPVRHYRILDSGVYCTTLYPESSRGTTLQVDDHSLPACFAASLYCVIRRLCGK